MKTKIKLIKSQYISDDTFKFSANIYSFLYKIVHGNDTQPGHVDRVND